MSKKSWPIHKGIFRVNCPPDFAHQCSPPRSPIVEMPLSPPPDLSETAGSQKKNVPNLVINTNMDSSISRGPFSPTIREIPIEVQQEVCSWTRHVPENDESRSSTHVLIDTCQMCTIHSYFSRSLYSFWAQISESPQCGILTTCTFSALSIFIVYLCVLIFVRQCGIN